jgi:hypothetical protein
VRFYQRMRGPEMLSGNNRKKQHRLHITCNVTISDAFPPKNTAVSIEVSAGQAFAEGGRVPAMGVAACCHLTLPALGVAACSGPATCRLRRWRQVPAGSGAGGTSHVSPAQACRHSELVFFGNGFQRWSFLPIHSRRWSVSSKIQCRRGYAAQAPCTALGGI